MMWSSRRGFNVVCLRRSLDSWLPTLLPGPPSWSLLPATVLLWESVCIVPSLPQDRYSVSID